MHSNKERIVVVDALRGFALLGIIFAHYTFWHTGGPLPPEVFAKSYGIGSSVATAINDIFISGRFFAFFSFLFGLSFFLQMERMQRASDSFAGRYMWKLFLLLLIAIVHQTFWMGDILIIYVPLGFVLLALRRLSNKAVLVLGAVLVLNLPNKIWEILNHFFIHWEAPDVFTETGKQYAEIVRHGTLTQLWRFNWSAMDLKANFQLFSGRLFMTLGYFLLGMYAGRKRWFEQPAAARPIVKKIFSVSWKWMLALVLLALGMVGANELWQLGWQENQVVGFFFGIIYDVASASMVLFYISGLTLLMYRPRWQQILYPLAPVGKMALTSYLSQTLVGLTLYFGFGFGLFLKTTPGWNWGIATLVFILQALGAKWWFSHFQNGPVEWLWRSGTRLQWQPLRKSNMYKPVSAAVPGI